MVENTAHWLEPGSLSSLKAHCACLWISSCAIAVLAGRKVCLEGFLTTLNRSNNPVVVSCMKDHKLWICVITALASHFLTLSKTTGFGFPTFQTGATCMVASLSQKTWHLLYPGDISQFNVDEIAATCSVRWALCCQTLVWLLEALTNNMLPSLTVSCWQMSFSAFSYS